MNTYTEKSRNISITRSKSSIKRALSQITSGFTLSPEPTGKTKRKTIPPDLVKPPKDIKPTPLITRYLETFTTTLNHLINSIRSRSQSNMLNLTDNLKLEDSLPIRKLSRNDLQRVDYLEQSEFIE
jgi:hypothetical protein